MIQIIPAILAKTPESYKTDIEKLNSSVSFQEGWVHIDFMDNKFVPNQSIDPEIVAKNPTPLKKEAHLMVEKPLSWVDKMVQNKFDRVIIHVESDNETSLKEAITKLKENKIEVGIAINPETSTDSLKPYLKEIDLILVMGVTPGFQGQPFNDGTFKRVKKLSGIFDLVSVDGGVKDTNTRDLVENGAKILVSGSFIMKGDVDEQVEKIWEIIEG